MQQKPQWNALKKQRKYYSGKKKRHTLKTQLVVDKKTMKTICLRFYNGKKHDFKLFKESGVHAGKDTKFETDTGYTGITAIHLNSILPKKTQQKHASYQRNNRLVYKKRIYVEHAIRFVKRFRILSEQYHNRRKRFALHFSLLTGICNFDMSV